MATKWKDLKHKATPEARENAKREALAEYAEVERIGVGVIRLARQQIQVAVAEQMHIPQSAVSWLENQNDCLLSTRGSMLARWAERWRCGPSFRTARSSSTG